MKPWKSNSRQPLYLCHCTTTQSNWNFLLYLCTSSSQLIHKPEISSNYTDCSLHTTSKDTAYLYPDAEDCISFLNIAEQPKHSSSSAEGAISSIIPSPVNNLRKAKYSSGEAEQIHSCYLWSYKPLQPWIKSNIRATNSQGHDDLVCTPDKMDWI